MRPGEARLVHGFAVFEGIAFLGALILFLVIIGNTLVRIDNNLGATATSAGNINTSASTLPAVVGTITDSLTAIDQAVKPIRASLGSINSGLGTTQGGLAAAESNLSSINGKLAHTESNLVLADQYAHRVDVALISDNSQLGQVISRVVSILGAAGGVHGDAANIGTGAVPINQHLASISTKTVALCPNLPLFCS
jgi:hypothetical protein